MAMVQGALNANNMHISMQYIINDLFYNALVQSEYVCCAVIIHVGCISSI